jgi:D-3-phosphoglycerate dehydrogenase
MAIAFMIMLCRNLYTSSVQHKSGTWSRNGGMNLRGKTVGIIGMGNIGKEVARLLKPFKCKVLVNDIVDQGEYYKKNKLREASKDEIYQEADFITIHTPLTDLTKYLINKGVLLKMKRSSYLINTARGAIVKQPDLKWALQNNIITGAALDVYDEEPPQDKEFLNLPNLICTPHIGGNSEESVLAMGRSAIKHLIEYFNHNKK